MRSIGLHEDTARSRPTYRTSVPRSRGHGDQCAAAVGRVASCLSSDTYMDNKQGGVPYRCSGCLGPLVDIAPTFTIAPQRSSTQRVRTSAGHIPSLSWPYLDDPLTV